MSKWSDYKLKYLITYEKDADKIIKYLSNIKHKINVNREFLESLSNLSDIDKDMVLFEVLSHCTITDVMLEKIFSMTNDLNNILLISRRCNTFELLNNIFDWCVGNINLMISDRIFINILCKVDIVSSDMIFTIASSTDNIEVLAAVIFNPNSSGNLIMSVLCMYKDNAEVVELVKKRISPAWNVHREVELSPSFFCDISPIEDSSVKKINDFINNINKNSSLDDKDETINGVSNNPNYNIEIEDNVTERLRRNVEDGMSTMMWGLSGIGKTARVSEVDPDYTMIKLKNDMLPEEVTGGKEPNGEPGEVYPPKWYVKLCEKCEKEPDKMHILFIDELTNVKNNVKSLVWEIIEDRRVNGDEDWKLPDNCAIVAAGNRPEESTSVITDYNGGVLPEPLHDRFDFHIEIPLDMKEWQKWALETDKKTGNLNIHPSVLSFCVGQGEKIMFSSLDVNDATKPRLSPRRWAKLSKAIYMAEKRGGKNCHVSNQRIAECIGSEIAPAFIAHYEKEPIDMKKVENGDYNPEDFNNIDDKLFALSSVLGEYNGSELAIEDFIVTCLGEDYLSIYKVMKKQRDEVVFDDKKDNGLNIEIVQSGMKKIV